MRIDLLLLYEERGSPKHTAAPIIRIFASVSPVIPASMAALPTGDINPHILAANNNEI